MMKKELCLTVMTLLLTMALLLSGCGGEQEPTTPPQTEETEAAAVTTQPQATTEPQQRYETKTVYLCVSSVDTDYLLGSTTVTNNEYDEFGNLVITERLDGEGMLRDRREYEYDEFGNQTVLSFYNKEEILEYRSVSQYDESGNMILCCTYDPEGVLTSQSVCTYDGFGNLLSEVCTDSNGNITYQVFNTYDAEGYLLDMVTEYTVPSTDSTYSFHTAYEYNENHTEESVYTVQEEARVLAGKKVYDENGRLLSALEYENGKCLSELSYTYDETGALLKETCIIPAPSAGNSHEVVYTYDDHGNLLSVTADTYMNGQNYGSQTNNTYEAREILIPVS